MKMALSGVDTLVSRYALNKKVLNKVTVPRLTDTCNHYVRITQ